MCTLNRSGEGLGWHAHNHRLFCGTESFFRTGYRAHLVSEWLPVLDGVVERLKHGARVADIGCGHGASTIVMAQAFPKSSFIGLDYHGRVDRDRACCCSAYYEAFGPFRHSRGVMSKCTRNALLKYDRSLNPHQ